MDGDDSQMDGYDSDDSQMEGYGLTTIKINIRALHKEIMDAYNHFNECKKNAIKNQDPPQQTTDDGTIYHIRKEDFEKCRNAEKEFNRINVANSQIICDQIKRLGLKEWFRSDAEAEISANDDIYTEMNCTTGIGYIYMFGPHRY